MEPWFRTTCERMLRLRGLRPVIQKRTGHLIYRRNGIVVFFLTENDGPHRPRRIKTAHVYATSRIPHPERMNAAVREAEAVHKLFPGMPISYSISAEGISWEGKMLGKKVVLRPLQVERPTFHRQLVP